MIYLLQLVLFYSKGIKLLFYGVVAMKLLINYIIPFPCFVVDILSGVCKFEMRRVISGFRRNLIDAQSMRHNNRFKYLWLLATKLLSMYAFMTIIDNCANWVHAFFFFFSMKNMWLFFVIIFCFAHFRWMNKSNENVNCTKIQWMRVKTGK